MFQELLFKKNKNWKSYGLLNVAIKQMSKAIDMITKLPYNKKKKKKKNDFLDQ